MNPATSLSTAISRSAKPAAKASAVIVVSGGMVASFALPASAATLTTPVDTKKAAATDVLAIAAPSAAQAPLASPEFGSIGFSGVAKPKPVRSSISSSRSATRVPLADVAPAPASAGVAPAPASAGVAPAPASAGVLGIAASLKGIYYIYGGTTLAGFDCSGYTQYVFNRVGIKLPRTAEQQRLFATPVSNPLPGDLVFFGAPAHHVGIYAGNGMMWDSPQSGAAIALRSIYASASYGRVR